VRGLERLWRKLWGLSCGNKDGLLVKLDFSGGKCF